MTFICDRLRPHTIIFRQRALLDCMHEQRSRPIFGSIVDVGHFPSLETSFLTMFLANVLHLQTS